MIRVVMLDLGETLVHDDATFPHVPEALRAMSELKTPDDEPLSLCLVSDFRMPSPPATTGKIEVIFEEYLWLLEQFGLREFFEPVERRVTLSTHAGVHKPHRHIFETALRRLEIVADLKECLFITENASHIVACRDLGMQALQFAATPGTVGADFSDWTQPLDLIRSIVAPED